MRGCVGPGIPARPEVGEHLFLHAAHDELHVQHVGRADPLHPAQLLLVRDARGDDLHDDRGTEPAQVRLPQLRGVADEKVSGHVQPRGGEDGVHLVLVQRSPSLALGSGEHRVDPLFHSRLPPAL